MIVDLVRNDLGRVCAPGSVEVRALAEPRPHTGVWHLVSEVAGRLREDARDADLLRAAFPPGSVTGAPKVAALGVIAELESTGREAYTGAIGFASPVAGLELSVAIRTFELAGERIWLGAGGGVVADSEPAAEAAEAATKADPLLHAIGATRATPRRPASSGRQPPRIGPRPLPRPDPAAGVFETIRARDGEAARLEAHLARLAASVDELYGARLPDDLSERVEAAAEAAGEGRIRVTAIPPAGAPARALDVTGATGPLPAGGAPVRLAPVVVPGGLGAHKWEDRRLIHALAAHTAPAIPLLVDLDGRVLEASWASVFVVEDGTLVTPPLDGRILPGVARQAVLDAAETAREEEITLDRLDRAGGVLLTNALRTLVVRGADQVAQALTASTISSGASSWM
jgi:para-aminobenzoate synthetase/4-amino-4-deoxychorismate lyase